MYNDMIHMLINILITYQSYYKSCTLSISQMEMCEYMQEIIVVYNYCRKSKVYYHFYTWHVIWMHMNFFHLQHTTIRSPCRIRKKEQ